MSDNLKITDPGQKLINLNANLSDHGNDINWSHHREITRYTYHPIKNANGISLLNRSAQIQSSSNICLLFG